LTLTRELDWSRRIADLQRPLCVRGFGGGEAGAGQAAKLR
jgi:hypothetical protein